MIMAVDVTANAGFKKAETLRRGLLDFSVGRFTHAPDFDPKYGCGYWWHVDTVKEGITVKTWKDLYEANRKNPPPPWVDHAGGCYFDLPLAATAIGVRTGHPKAKEAYDCLVANIKNVFRERLSGPTFADSAVPIR